MTSIGLRVDVFKSLHAGLLVSSSDIFKVYFFKNYSRNTIGVSIILNPDQNRRFVILILVQTTNAMVIIRRQKSPLVSQAFVRSREQSEWWTVCEIYMYLPCVFRKHKQCIIFYFHILWILCNKHYILYISLVFL